MSDLNRIEIELLSIDTPDKFLAVRQKLDVAKGIIKALEALLGEKALEIVEASGPIDAGDVVYKIVTEATHKAKKAPKEMAQGILDALDGDWDGYAACLSSSAIKHGQLRTLLEERGNGVRFGEFFDRVEKKTVEGKPVKRVAPISKLFSSAR